MALEILVGDQVQVVMSSGVAADYTYLSSSPNKASVDAAGIVTANAVGTVIITITRISDSEIVDRVRVYVRSSLDSRDPARPYAIPTIVP